MSKIAPDVPELSQVPQVVRGVVWTRATMRAIRAPLTLALAGFAAIALAAAGAFAGASIGGFPIALAGGVVGVIGAGWFYLRVLVDWQARRLLPRVLAEENWS